MFLFMQYFRKKGIKISSYDFGQVTENDHEYLCCGFDNVAPWDKVNFGNINTAIRFVQRADRPVAWSDFDSYVQQKGGFLSGQLRSEVRGMWNLGLYKDKDQNLAIDFGAHLLPVGEDDDGLIWKYDKTFDFRLEPIQRFLEEVL